MATKVLPRGIKYVFTYEYDIPSCEKDESIILNVGNSTCGMTALDGHAASCLSSSLPWKRKRKRKGKRKNKRKREKRKDERKEKEKDHWF